MMTDMAEKKRSTIVTIAEELGVSPSTVSRAFLPDSPISSEVRERILRCAAEQGYIPNRAASRLSMREITIGIAMSDCYMQGVNEMLRGIEDAFRSLYDYKLNVKVRLFHAERQSQSDIRRLLSALYDCDGIIVRGIASCEGLSELSAFSKLHRNVLNQQGESMKGLAVQVLVDRSRYNAVSDILVQLRIDVERYKRRAAFHAADSFAKLYGYSACDINAVQSGGGK